MRILIDLVDEEAGNPGGGMHDASSIREDGDAVVFAIRETELRMTDSQAADLSSALRRWLFSPRSEVDVKDETWCELEEHEHLRSIIRAMLAGELRGNPVPEELRDALRWELSMWNLDRWRNSQELIEELRQEIEELKGRLSRRAKRNGQGGEP